MNRTLQIALGLLVLMGCSQAITIPDQAFLVSMGELGSCWRDNASTAICNCAATEVKKTYVSDAALQNALADPTTRARAQAVVQDALLQCDPASKHQTQP